MDTAVCGKLLINLETYFQTVSNPLLFRSKILDNGSLVIINVQIEDQGEYTCTASNNGENYGFSFDPVSVTTSVKVNSGEISKFVSNSFWMCHFLGWYRW